MLYDISHTSTSADALAADPLHPEATYNLGLMRWRRAESSFVETPAVLSGSHLAAHALKLTASGHNNRGVSYYFLVGSESWSQFGLIVGVRCGLTIIISLPAIPSFFAKNALGGTVGCIVASLRSCRAQTRTQISADRG